MIDKKEFLLQSIIKAYIEHLEPIGSTQLKSMYDIAYSPATIRGYFKKLGDEGFLAQEHISSGRTPTSEALKQYWQSKLNFELKGVNIKALKHFAQEVGVSVFVKNEKTDSLQNIINVEDRYIILEFTSFAVSIKYSSALYRFLDEMRTLSLQDILKISKDVGAFELHSVIKNSMTNNDFEIYNYKEFFDLSLHYNFNEYLVEQYLKGYILDELSQGLYFEELLPNDYIGICHNCMIEGQKVKMLVVGQLSKNYEYFYKNITRF